MSLSSQVAFVRYNYWSLIIGLFIHHCALCIYVTPVWKCHIICVTWVITQSWWEAFSWLSNQSQSSSPVIHKWNTLWVHWLKKVVAQHAHSLTPTVLSLYNSRFQHRETNRTGRGNMRSLSLCIVLSLAVTVYCVPVSQVSVQDETFAEVCSMHCYYFAFKIKLCILEIFIVP